MSTTIKPRRPGDAVPARLTLAVSHAKVVIKNEKLSSTNEGANGSVDFLILFRKVNHQPRISPAAERGHIEVNYMRLFALTIFLALLPVAIHAGPRYVDVTAEKPQKHIQVDPSSLGEGFGAFSIRVNMEDVEIPSDLRAYLILRNDKGNLLSTPMKPTVIEKGLTQFYAAIHSDLLKWAQVHLRDNMRVYVIKLGSFKNAFEKK